MSDPYADAERLVRAAQEAAEQAAAASSEPPPRGWQAPHSAPAGGGPAFPDLSGLLALAETLKGTVPPELAQQLTDALRDLLIALRSILDYSIARLERPATEPAAVEDIPID
jgi:hypothetical protein